MFQSAVLFAVLLCLVTIGLLYLSARHLLVGRLGKITLFLGVFLFPASTVVSGLTYAYTASSQTSFCLECHEMGQHGQSLFLDDVELLPAVHYQKRLIKREDTCFACHTDYAMFGDIKAKLNGLRHVWVHYIGPIPEKFELYEPFHNRNCLHCHDDSRSFLEVSSHQEHRTKLLDNSKSCLSCHSGGHALDQINPDNFWDAQPLP